MTSRPMIAKGIEVLVRSGEVTASRAGDGAAMALFGRGVSAAVLAASARAADSGTDSGGCVTCSSRVGWECVQGNPEGAISLRGSARVVGVQRVPSIGDCA